NYAATAYFTPNDPFYASANAWGQGHDDLWNLKKIGLSAAWDRSQGEGVVVGVVDTGIDLVHPDIAANLWTNSDEIAGNGVDDDHNGFVDDRRGWDFANSDADPTDDFGHGTHVAGTIAAVGNNGQGVIGVAPRSTLMPLKALDLNGSGSTDGLALAIVYAAQNGADVINNSWGCSFTCPTNPVVEDAVTLAHDLGAVVVFASGNFGIDIKDFSPQNYPDVITVAASDPNDQRPFFSNTGAVDVAAPGGGPDVAPPAFEPFRNLLSLKSNVCNVSGMCPPELLVGSGYLRQAGTSMAAPHVAGLAALILEQNPTYSPEEVRQVLRRSAVDTGAVGLDSEFGYGRVDAARATLEPRPLAALIRTPNPARQGILTGTSPVDVIGNAAGTGFASYRLEDGVGAAPASFTTITTSTTQVNNARLGSWNLANAAEGLHTLRVVAATTDGRTYEDRQQITVDNVRITTPAPQPLAFSRGNENVTISGTIAPAGFTSYTLAILRSNGTALPGAAITLANGGTQRVVNGTLATWNTTGVAADQYTLSFTVNATGGPFTETSRLAVDPTLHAGWPKQLSTGFNTIFDHLTAADVNGDGRPDLVIGDGNTVRIFDHTGAQLPGWPQSVDPNGFGAIVQRAPAVADVTGDSVPEIITGNSSGQVLVFRANGTLLPGFPRFTLAAVHGFAVADIDNNGTREIIVTGNGTSQIEVLRSDGSSLPGWPQTPHLGADIMTAPAVGDMDGDGRLEIVVAIQNAPCTLHVYNSSGTQLAGWPKVINQLGPNLLATSYPALGDLDGDGRLDVVTGAVDGSVQAYRWNGSAVPGWPRATGSPGETHSPALGDIDGDGRLDVVIGGNTVVETATGRLFDFLFAFRHDGTPLPGFPVSVGEDATTVSTRYFSGFGAPALVDLDNDNRLDIVVASDSFSSFPAYPLDRVYALRGYRSDGTVLPGFPRVTAGIGQAPTNTAALLDIDADGKHELAWVDLERNLYLWDLDTPSTARASWPQYAQNPAHTARVATTTVTIPPAPANLRATPGNAQVSLTWTASSGATSYNVRRSTTSGTGFVTIASGLTATNYVNTGLTNGTTYFYVVTATNGAGTSGNSNQATATPSGGGGGAACSGAITVTGGQSGNFNTTGAVCYRTSDTINGWGCSNFQGRSVSVNGTPVTCGQVPLPAKLADGFRYFSITAGSFAWASFHWWQ
ncbi:MAG TPA: S8 family serine peptidase, partial [Ilumatobacteraceae bacterium]